MTSREFPWLPQGKPGFSKVIWGSRRNFGTRCHRAISRSRNGWESTAPRWRARSQPPTFIFNFFLDCQGKRPFFTCRLGSRHQLPCRSPAQANFRGWSGPHRLSAPHWSPESQSPMIFFSFSWTAGESGDVTQAGWDPDINFRVEVPPSRFSGGGTAQNRLPAPVGAEVPNHP